MNEVQVSETQNEVEVELIGRITDPKGLEAADSVIKIDQYSIKNSRDDGQSGSIRVRRSEFENGRVDYEVTIKEQKVEREAVYSVETTQPTDEAFYNAFIPISKMSTHKTRYVFIFENLPVMVRIPNEELREVILPRIEYEVDTFTYDGELSPWCKIDIEIDAIQDFLQKDVFPGIEASDIRFTIPTNFLSFGVRDVFNAKRANERQKEILDNLYSSNIFGIFY